MKKYCVEQTETGTCMEECYFRQTAELVIKMYEGSDEASGIYTPDFYQIVEIEVEDDGKEDWEMDAYDQSIIHQLEEYL